MKVIAFNGSPHEKGSTYAALSLVTAELEKQGIETEIIHVGTKTYHGCTGCGACAQTGRCIFTDDLVNECIGKLEQADGLLLGSPVHYAGVAGSMKAFLDRVFYCYAGKKMHFKVGAVVTALRRAGGVDTFHQLNNYLNLANMLIVPNHYWNVAYGTNGEEVRQDAEGVQIMQMLGRKMAWLLQTVARGKQTLPPPEAPARIHTNFIRP